MSPQAQALALLAWFGALQLARLGYSGARTRRFDVSMLAGALTAHAGWALLYVDRLSAAQLLSATGFSVLFLPLGPLLLAPWRAGSRDVEHFLSDAARALAPAIACARLACLLVGCCNSVGAFPWLGPLLEGGAMAAVGIHGRRRRSGRHATTHFCVVLGATRALAEPWRAPGPPGPPLLSPLCFALAWIAVGLALAARSTRERHRVQSGFSRPRTAATSASRSKGLARKAPSSGRPSRPTRGPIG